MDNKEVINGKLKGIIAWVLISAGIICVVINVAVGWPAWSVITSFSLWMIWHNFVCCKWLEPLDSTRVLRLLLDICILLAITSIVFLLGIGVWLITISLFIVCFVLKFKVLK